MTHRFFYGPPNWLVTKFTSEDRRMFGFWTVIFSVVGTIILQALAVRYALWFLWLAALSIVALIPNFSSETPVETEE